MALSQNRFFIIACEGESEVAYVQELNRLFRELEIATTLQPVCIGSGFFSNVVTAYRNTRKNNPRTPIYIWVDWDIYARNDRKCMEAYSCKLNGIPDFHFSRQNFEDFLATHLSEDELECWIEVCRQNGHLQIPLHSETYVTLMENILFPSYVKGTLPFDMTEGRIEQMLDNQCNAAMPLQCDFAEVIRQIIRR